MKFSDKSLIEGIKNKSLSFDMEKIKSKPLRWIKYKE